MLQSKTQTNKAYLLSIAAKHFARDGFAGARVDEIAADAQLNKATLYYQIGNKQELYRQVFVHCFEQLHRHVATSVEQEVGLQNQLRSYIHSLAQELHQGAPYLSRIMMHEIASGGEHLPDEAIHYIGEIKQVLVDIFKQIDQAIVPPEDIFFIHILSVGVINFFVCSESVRTKVLQSWNDNHATEKLCSIDFVITRLNQMIEAYLQSQGIKFSAQPISVELA